MPSRSFPCPSLKTPNAYLRPNCFNFRILASTPCSISTSSKSSVRPGEKSMHGMSAANVSGGPAQEYAPAIPPPSCKVHKQDKSD